MGGSIIITRWESPFVAGDGGFSSMVFDKNSEYVCTCSNRNAAMLVAKAMTEYLELHGDSPQKRTK